MIVETYKDKIKNDAIRMEIIDLIMNIYNTKSLQFIKSVTKGFYEKEYLEHPMTIDEIACMVCTKDIKEIMKALKKAEPNQIAIEQMKEIFGDMLLCCSGNGDTKKKNQKKVKEES